MFCLTTNDMSNLWYKSLKCSTHLSGDCHPAIPAFKIQQTVLVGFKDESQNQCGKHIGEAEKHGVENLLLSDCFKDNLYKTEKPRASQYEQAHVCTWETMHLSKKEKPVT